MTQAQTQHNTITLCVSGSPIAKIVVEPNDLILKSYILKVDNDFYVYGGFTEHGFTYNKTSVFDASFHTKTPVL